jgi:hypothetical protein
MPCATDLLFLYGCFQRRTEVKQDTNSKQARTRRRSTLAQKRYRQRQRLGRGVWMVEGDQAAVIDVLVTSRRLAEKDTGNRRAIEGALSELLAEVITVLSS